MRVGSACGVSSSTALLGCLRSRRASGTCGLPPPSQLTGGASTAGRARRGANTTWRPARGRCAERRTPPAARSRTQGCGQHAWGVEVPTGSVRRARGDAGRPCVTGKGAGGCHWAGGKPPPLCQQCCRRRPLGGRADRLTAAPPPQRGRPGRRGGDGKGGGRASA